MTTQPKKSQTERLLAWMQVGGYVTRLSAVTDFGIFELSTRIGEIEARGHIVSRQKIKVPTRFGGVVPVMQYWIE